MSQSKDKAQQRFDQALKHVEEARFLLIQAYAELGALEGVDVQKKLIKTEYERVNQLWRDLSRSDAKPKSEES